MRAFETFVGLLMSPDSESEVTGSAGDAAAAAESNIEASPSVPELHEGLHSLLPYFQGLLRLFTAINGGCPIVLPLNLAAPGFATLALRHRGYHSMVYDVELLYFLPRNTLEKMIQCFRNYVLNNCSPLTHLEAPPCFSTSMSVQSVTAIDPSATKDEV